MRLQSANVPLAGKRHSQLTLQSQLFLALVISLSLSSISSNRASVTFLSCDFHVLVFRETKRFTVHLCLCSSESWLSARSL